MELVNSMGSGKPGCLDAMECRYYDHNTSAWSTEGCTTTQYNRSGVSAIGCSCSHLSDFVAVKVPTSLREKLDLALIVVPRSSPAADPPPDYIMFDMTVTPGNRFVALTKDSVSAPPTKVTVRLSFAEAEPPQLWRIVSIGCANGTDLCALPTSAVALADQSQRWQLTRPDARLEASADLIVSFNASGLPENPAADAYSTELGIEVVEASGEVRLVTLGVSASVAAEAVANRSSWGAVPPGRSCAEANLGEYAVPQVPAVVGRQLRVPISLCDFEGLAVVQPLTLTLTPTLTPTLTLTLTLPLLTLTLTLTLPRSAGCPASPTHASSPPSLSRFRPRRGTSSALRRCSPRSRGSTREGRSTMLSRRCRTWATSLSRPSSAVSPSGRPCTSWARARRA